MEPQKPENSPAEDASPEEKEGMRAVNFEHTSNLPDVLQQLGCSLLVSTYQAGKVMVLGSHQGQMVITFHNFEQAMGIAARPDKLAIGSRRQMWILKQAHELAPHIAPQGTYDRCFLARKALYTGSIHGHEMAWIDEDLWVVNTLFSAICSLNEDCNFVPRWQPPFISSLAAEDRCHLNGFALVNNRIRYATAMAQTDTPNGWRENKAKTGILMEVPSGNIVSEGLSMPHSPRWHDNHLWVLDSGRGNLSIVDSSNGKRDPVVELPGYTRGLDFIGPYAAVGLSQIRETNIFGGLPISEKGIELHCGVTIVDTRRGAPVAGIRFKTGVEEVFDVKFLPGIHCPKLAGPFPNIDNEQDIWYVPHPSKTPPLP
ncbi:TPR repeat:TPR repeat [Planctomycetales bacterium 10988]|nr:TPR repeat:TPR repeat [Planctomycetales bacterium 10988]